MRVKPRETTVKEKRMSLYNRLWPEFSSNSRLLVLAIFRDLSYSKTRFALLFQESICDWDDAKILERIDVGQRAIKFVRQVREERAKVRGRGVVMKKREIPGCPRRASPALLRRLGGGGLAMQKIAENRRVDVARRGVQRLPPLFA